LSRSSQKGPTGIYPSGLFSFGRFNSPLEAHFGWQAIAQCDLPLRYQELASKAAGESSAPIRERVNTGRAIQLQRFRKRTIHSNAQMGAKDIKRYCAVKEEGDKLLESAINKLGLSARAYSRVLKVSRTIADLARSEENQHAQIDEAIDYRSLDRRM
jgi:magnesium chelatase family protein